MGHWLRVVEGKRNLDPAILLEEVPKEKKKEPSSWDKDPRLRKTYNPQLGFREGTAAEKEKKPREGKGTERNSLSFES